MPDSMQRTVVLVTAIVGLCALAGVTALAGRDPSGLIVYAVVSGLLSIAGILAGAHAGNAHGPLILPPVPRRPDQTVVIPERREAASQGGPPAA